LDGQKTCAESMAVFLSPEILNKATLTAAECDDDMEKDFNFRLVLLYVQTDCCDGGPLPLQGPCGDNFPSGTFCKSDTAFDPNAEGGEFHCDGDEDIKDPANCQYNGLSAWNSHEGECDVDLLNEDHVSKSQACVGLGGEWKPVRCLEMYNHVVRNYAGFDQQVCSASELVGMWNSMADTCCPGNLGKHIEDLNCPSELFNHVCKKGTSFMPEKMLPSSNESDMEFTCKEYVRYMLANEMGMTQLADTDCERRITHEGGEDYRVKHVFHWVNQWCCDGAPDDDAGDLIAGCRAGPWTTSGTCKRLTTSQWEVLKTHNWKPLEC